MVDINAHAARILRLLRQREIKGEADPISASAIAAALQVDPSTARMAIELLLVRRCVLFAAAPSDTVTLTELGRVVASQPTRRAGGP